MNRIKENVLGMLVVGLCITAAVAQAMPTATSNRPDAAVDLSVLYSTLHTNAPVGSNSTFWMKGGTAEIAIPVYRSLSVVGEVGRHTISNNSYLYSNTLNLLTIAGGLRWRFYNHTRVQPFGQALAGFDHGSNNCFPRSPVQRGTNADCSQQSTSSDNSALMVLGGGLDWNISRHIWIRLPQADFHYSQLHNGEGDRQNQLRLSAGAVFRFGARHAAPPTAVVHPVAVAVPPVQCVATPSVIYAGEQVHLHALNTMSGIEYSWTSADGTVSTKGENAVIDTTDFYTGNYVVTIGHVADGNSRVNDCMSSFTVRERPRPKEIVEPAPPPSPPLSPPPHVDDPSGQRAQLRSQLNAVQKTTESSRGLNIILNSVLFDTAKHTLTPNAESVLSRVASILKKYPGLEIHIEGHTDSVGGAEYNQRLSEDRARTVRDYLVRNGLSSPSIRAVGYGKRHPVASNATAVGRTQNRRVDIFLAGDVIGMHYREP